jgi:hypothetical protein
MRNVVRAGGARKVEKVLEHEGTKRREEHERGKSWSRETAFRVQRSVVNDQPSARRLNPADG